LISNNKKDSGIKQQTQEMAFGPNKQAKKNL
jgi:hypothetical protein